MHLGAGECSGIQQLIDDDGDGDGNSGDGEMRSLRQSAVS
jgi:hypothetical protein